MKAAVFNKFGGPEVLHIEEIQKPIPKSHEVLVKIHAAGVNSGDSRIRGARFPRGFGMIARPMFGIFRPRKRVLGVTFSGTVESTGEEVTLFKKGDEVFGMAGWNMGAYAEYITIKENKAIVLKPSKLSHNEAAALPFGGTTALFFLRDKAKLTKGQKVLVNGASGAVGTNAVQIAKYLGANVTGVCSTDNVELVKSLGADKVIDYKKQNIFEMDENYDLVVDTVGNISISEGKTLLTENGKLALIVAGLSEFISRDKQVLAGTATEKKEDIEFLSNLTAEDKLKVVIDKVYKLDEVVEAHRHVDGGHKKGNVVLTIVD